MIEAVAGPRGTALAGSLAPGTVAYVDADWLPAGRSGPVPAVVVDRTEDSDARGALPCLRVARYAVAALDCRSAGCVHVQGVGMVASHIRDLLADRDFRLYSGGSPRPATVIDVTGDPDGIVDATRMVDDLGTIVLAGETLGRRFDLDLYPHVHSRGLTMVGVASLHKAGLSDEPAGGPRVPMPVVVLARQPVPAGARWYRVESDARRWVENRDAR